MIVNLPPNKDVQLVWAGDNPGIIINRDLTQLVYIGDHSAFVVPGEGSIIDALTFVQYSGDVDIYAHSGGPNFCQVDVQPNNENWSPSPAQSAASLVASGIMMDTTGQSIVTNVLPLAKDTSVTPLAKDTSITPLAKDSSITPLAKDTSVAALPGNIAITGVPLLNLKTALQNTTGQVVAAGATFTGATITGITQPSFNLHITTTCSGSATKPWFTVRLNWIDSATGLVIQVDAYTSFMSNSAGLLTTIISGPTDADSLQIQITNNDTLSMTINQLFAFMSSRPNYTSDFYYHFWTGASMPNIPTFQNGASDAFPTNRVIFDLSRSVGVGVTTTPDYTLPSYAGNASLTFGGGSSNQWQVVLQNKVTGTNFLNVVTAGTGILNPIPIILPRMPISLRVTNNGSVSGNVNLEITAV